MAKVKIEDLPKDLKISEKELRQVMGGKMMPYTDKYGGWGMPLDVLRYGTQPWTFFTDAYDSTQGDEMDGSRPGGRISTIPKATRAL